MKRPAVLNELRNAVKPAVVRALPLCPGLKQRYFVDYVFPEKAGPRSKTIRNLRVLTPARQVKIAAPNEDAFVPIGKYFREGSFTRPNIFVCEVPEAILDVGSGYVCTREMTPVIDLECRITHYPNYGKRKPRNVQHISGTCSSVNYYLAGNPYHWMIDCLPRLHSLAKAEPEAKVTLIMPESLGSLQRESLECVLPRNFVIDYRPGRTWLQVERFLWPSLVSGRCNALLPVEYYDSIRLPTFKKFGLSNYHQKTGRIYITRRRAKRRRVTNEEAVCALLSRYGFQTMELESMSFRQQVEIFHQAEIVIGPHGAGLNLIMFSGAIHVMVLHPNRVPQNQYHTLATGLGQKYHFLLHDGAEEDDFTVSPRALECLLQTELGLVPRRT